MPRTKLMPTSAPKPIPPEFMEKFIAHGWRRVENIWGKSTVLAWSKVIGAKRMAELRKAHLAAQRGTGAPIRTSGYTGALARQVRSERASL